MFSRKARLGENPPYIRNVQVDIVPNMFPLKFPMGSHQVLNIVGGVEDYLAILMDILIPSAP